MMLNKTQRKRFNNYNKALLSLISLILVSLAFLNYFIDPFAVFSKNVHFFNNIKPSIKRQERLTKLISLKRARDIDTIFVGSSRVDFSISENYYNKITGQKAFNLAVQGARLNEIEYLTKEAIKYQPTLKRVVIGIDYDFYYTKDESTLDTIKEYDKSLFDSYSTLLLSADATSSSFMTIIKSLNPHYKAGFYADGMKRIFVNNKIEDSFLKTIDQYKDAGENFNSDNLDLTKLKQFVEYLKSQGIEVILYLQPVHSSMLEIMKQNGALEYLLYFKYSLNEIQPFYDFYYPSDYSNEPITENMQYFFETSHCTYLVGERILDKIFLNKGKYGYLTNQNDITSKHQEFMHSLTQWENENNDWVNKIKEIRGN